MRNYIKVDVVFTEEGIMLPRSIIWRDGREFPVDRVLDIRQAASRKDGGQGDRYTVRIANRERQLFFERSPNLTGSVLGRWFVESAE